MKKAILTLFVLFVSVSLVSAQRNNVKFLGGCFDNLISIVKEDEGNSDLNLSNKFAIQLGYERSVGSHITVGLNFFYMLSFDMPKSYDLPPSLQGGSFPSYGETLILPDGFSVQSATVRDKGYGFIYESKYFFNEFREEAEGAYISANLGFYPYTESLTNIQGVKAGSSSWNTMYSPHGDIENDYTITRYGVKLGLQGSQAMSAELYTGIFFNSAPSQGLLYTGPTAVNSVSFVVGLIYGVPF